MLYIRSRGWAVALFLSMLCGVTAATGAEAVKPVATRQLSLNKFAARQIPFNTGWLFHRDQSRHTAQATATNGNVPKYALPTLDDHLWRTETLPHVAKISGAYQSRPWQGICWYRRHFRMQTAWHGKDVYVQFGAAMQIADAWCNGHHLIHHMGGYLPFSVNITRYLLPDQSNVLAVRLDNRDTTLTPPAKPTSGLDFNYPGGLYRGVRLAVLNPVHISDPVEADIVAGGGVFVMTPKVSRQQASVVVSTDVVNTGTKSVAGIFVTWLIYTKHGNLTTSESSPAATIASGEHHTFRTTFTIEHPKLWSPRNPYLYILHTQVRNQPQPAVPSLDIEDTQFGIRHLRLGHKAVYINGKPYVLRGTNRHQEYPCIEYALSPQASARDAILIRRAGFNMVRLSHYPQDPAFLDECDKIGLMCMEPIPGWQQWRYNKSFVNGCYTNIQQMIRRDRNHPCIVFWETSLNETSVPDWFVEKSKKLAHAEIPDHQCFTFGQDMFTQGPGAKTFHWDVQGYFREYGDWNFGGNHSTSRALRSFGEAAMLLQAWNFQYTLNNIEKLRTEPAAKIYGAGNWCMYDYNRGYYPVQEYSGDMNIFRVPKFVYYFFQSQAGTKSHIPNVQTGPMVFPATWWTSRQSPTKVIVFSNCQRVALYLNGKLIRTQSPDNGPDRPYGGGKGSLATLGNTFAGEPTGIDKAGNCQHLAHPPFTFKNIPYAPGSLKVVGYIQGKPVASYTVRTPGKPTHLRIVFDTEGIPLTANGADTVFVHAELVDRHGTLVPINNLPVVFKVRGPGMLIGANPFNSHAGMSNILLQAGLQAGTITVTATTPGLPPRKATINSLAPHVHYESVW